MSNVIALADYRQKKLGDDMARLIEYLLSHAGAFVTNTDLYMKVTNQEDGVVIMLKKEPL